MFAGRVSALPLPAAGAGLRGRFAEWARTAANGAGQKPAREVCGELISLIDEILAAEARRLSRAEREALSDLRADLWDAQIEEDAKSGALDHLIEQARARRQADGKPAA